jgi:hypothetical protein
MIVSTFRSPYDTTPNPLDVSWDHIVEKMSVPIVALEKDSVGLFSPAEFRVGGGKAKPAVIAIGFGVLDLDKVSTAGLGRLADRLREMAIAYVIASTWKHTIEKPRYRLVVPFDRKVPADQWSAFWPRLLQVLCPEADDACSDPNRCYYWPSCPADRLDQFQVFSGQGKPIDTSTILSAAAPPKRLPKVFTRVSREQLLAFGERLAKSRDEHAQAHGTILGRIAKGHAYAEVGERDSVTFEISKVLAEKWPDSDPEEIAELFRESISQMSADGGIDEAGVADKIRRCQDRAREDRDGLRRSDFEDRKRRISEAFGDPDRTYPYSEDELLQIAISNGCSKADLNHRWIVQHGRTYYVLGPHGYHAHCREDGAVAASIDLSPASSAGVDTFRFDKGLRTLLSIGEMVAAHGTVARSVEASLTAAATYYDPARRVIVEAGPRRRPLTPLHNPDIAAWIEALGGTDAHLINAWLKYSADNSRPSAALCLFGAKGVGKSLLAHGISQIWECQAPTSLKTVAQWTDRILNCPLLFADEEMPRDSRGRVNTAWIRELIQARAIPLERKYMPGATISGSVRLIVAANNPEILRTDDPLTADDIAALAERFIFIKCNPAAEALFKGWAAADPAATAQLTEYWASEGIARHVLWLAENYEHTPQGRFLVKGDSLAIQRTLATQSGLGSLVIQWLGEAVTSPSRIPAEARAGCFFEPDGSFLVTTSAVESGWGAILPWARQYTARAISNELRKLGEEGPRKHRDGRRLRTYAIDLEALETWAVESGRCDRGELQAIIRKEATA